MLSSDSLGLRIITIIILCCLGFFIYSNTFYSPFTFDDNSSIVKNISIRDITNLKAIWSFWPTRFITYLSFSFNYYFNQLQVFGYHIINLAIHLCTTILVWYFIMLTISLPIMKKDKISKYSRLAALFGALVFLSHPIQTESVTYIVQRTSALAGFFYIFSLCLYVKARVLRKDDKTRVIGMILYILSLIIGIVSMFTKENTFTLPLIIILYEFCFLKDDRHFSWKYIIPFIAILPIIPLTLLAAKPETFTDIQRFMSQPVKGYHYFLTQLRVMVTYVRLVFLPVNQNLDYYYPMIRSWASIPVLSSFFLLMLIITVAVRVFARFRLISFGIFWFFLTLLPESSIVPMKDVIFEHRLYLPMIGYSIFLTSLICYRFGEKTVRPVVIVFIALIACYSMLTYSRNFVWRDTFTLWNDTVQKSTFKARPYVQRGLAYAYKGELDLAIIDYNKAIEIDPDYAKAYHNIAVSYFYKKDYDKSWDYIYKTQALGCNFSPDFLEELEKKTIMKKQKENHIR